MDTLIHPPTAVELPPRDQTSSTLTSTDRRQPRHGRQRSSLVTGAGASRALATKTTDLSQR